jgi:site-specific recombinase XerC
MDIQTSSIYFINDGILSGKSKTTLQKYHYSVKLLIDYLKLQFLPLEMDSLNAENLQAFILHGITVRKWNKITTWTMHLKLNAYFNWLIKKEYILKNPLDNIPKPKIVKQPPKALNEAEIQGVLRAVAGIKHKYKFIDIRDKAIVATLLMSGLRKSELLDLKYQDVDLNNGFITVEHGKGDKRREIPIEQSILQPVLEEYRSYRDSLGRAKTWFFTGSWSGSNEFNRLSSSNIEKLFSRLSKVCGRRIHPHKLRHSFATLLLDKTGDVYTLKELMGHSDIATTCIYLSSTRRKKIEAISHLKLN